MPYGGIWQIESACIEIRINKSKSLVVPAVHHQTDTGGPLLDPSSLQREPGCLATPEKLAISNPQKESKR
jgi:hypothetical protein